MGVNTFRLVALVIGAACWRGCSTSSSSAPSYGLQARALATDEDLAQASGIRPLTVTSMIWFVAGIAGGLAGAFYGVGSAVGPLLGWREFLFILLVVLVGGTWGLGGVIAVGIAAGIALTAMALAFGQVLYAEARADHRLHGPAQVARQAADWKGRRCRHDVPRLDRRLPRHRPLRLVMIIGLALLLHLQLGLTRIANFGIVGFWGLGMYAFGVLYVQVDWPFGDPWQFIVAARLATLIAGLAGLVIGWLISDLGTDGVLLETLGFATLVSIFATTERDITGGARGLGGLRFPFDVGTVKQNEFAVAADPQRRGRRHLPLRQTGPPLAVWAAAHRHRQQRGAGTQPGQVHLSHQAAGVRHHIGPDGPAGCDVRGHGALPRLTNLGVDLTLAAMVGLVLGGTARVWGAVVGAVLAIGLFDIVVQAYMPLPQEWYRQALPVLGRPSSGPRW